MQRKSLTFSSIKEMLNNRHATQHLSSKEIVDIWHTLSLSPDVDVAVLNKLKQCTVQYAKTFYLSDTISLYAIWKKLGFKWSSFEKLKTTEGHGLSTALFISALQSVSEADDFCELLSNSNEFGLDREKVEVNQQIRDAIKHQWEKLKEKDKKIVNAELEKLNWEIEMTNSQQKKVELTESYKNLFFSGPYADNYKEFLKFVKEYKGDEDYTTLGTISNKNNRYFPKTKKVIQYGTNFLNHFWEDNKNVASTIAFQHAKYEAQNEVKEKKPKSPSNISFYDVTLDDKKYCWVSVSGAKLEKSEITKRLQNCIDEINAKTDEVNYVLLSPSRNTMMLTSILSDTFPTHCSESKMSALFIKYLLEGKKIKIEGAVNLLFYPFEKDKKYGLEENSIDKTVTFITISQRNIITLNNNIITPAQCSCEYCQANKPTTLKIWKAAQEGGKLNTDKKAERARLATSPIRIRGEEKKKIVATQSTMYGSPKNSRMGYKNDSSPPSYGRGYKKNK